MKAVASLRGRLARVRQPARAARLAIVLWVALAIAVWNVIFDRVIVLAGRRYVIAASEAATAGRPYVLINEWMGPAVDRALWIASAAGLGILAIGVFAVRAAAKRDRHARRQELPCTPSSTR
jgi:hypothetical protein